MTEIELVLAKVRDLIKTVNVSLPPGDRVWARPTDDNAIVATDFPFVVVSKLNAEVGAWGFESYGTGRHRWKVLVAVYLAPGPIIMTSADELTSEALAYANEWYKAVADVLMANLKLDGLVDIVGDVDSGLFEYITDNILWDGQQYYGHLISIPVYQSVVQATGA